MLREIIKRAAPDLRAAIDIKPFGDAKAVKNALAALKLAGVKAIAVRDADQSADFPNDLFVLPGSLPPEKEVFLHSSGKQALIDEYGFNLDSHLADYPETDHHDYSTIAAQKSASSREVIEADCIRRFLDAQPGDWASELVKEIKDRMSKF